VHKLDVGSSRLCATKIPNFFLPIYKVICPSHCPHQPTPSALIQFLFYFIFFFPYHFYDSLLLHVPGIFFKTSFLIFLCSWELFKTWGRQSVAPLHVPHTPPLFFTPNFFSFFFFLFFFFSFL
jgi:hypothetical protein